MFLHLLQSVVNRVFFRLFRNIRWRQCCQPCGFPANLGLFFCGVAGFEDLRVACFWDCLNWNLLVLWDCFVQIYVLWIASFSNCMALVCFNLPLKPIWACFCENVLIFGLLFRMCLPVFPFNFPSNSLFCWTFLPNACWACFSVKLPILGLFFKFTYLFLQNNLASLAEIEQWENNYPQGGMNSARLFSQCETVFGLLFSQ